MRGRCSHDFKYPTLDVCSVEDSKRSPAAISQELFIVVNKNAKWNTAYKNCNWQSDTLPSAKRCGASLSGSVTGTLLWYQKLLPRKHQWSFHAPFGWSRENAILLPWQGFHCKVRHRQQHQSQRTWKQRPIYCGNLQFIEANEACCNTGLTPNLQWDKSKRYLVAGYEFLN